MLESEGWEVGWPISSNLRAHYYKLGEQVSVCTLAIRLEGQKMLPAPPDIACKLCLRKVKSEGGK